MRTYLRSDYALHPCGAGYEYCDGECSHCEAAASTYTSNTTQPKYEPWRKDKLEVISYKETEGREDTFDAGVQWMAELIDKQPTVEAVPVVHGKWIKNELLSTDFAPVYDCSECHKSIEQKYITLPPRCEHCGALMDWRCR